MINHSKIRDCFIYWMLLTVPLIFKSKEYYLGYAMQIILVIARISDLLCSTMPVLETLLSGLFLTNYMKVEFSSTLPEVHYLYFNEQFKTFSAPC